MREAFANAQRSDNSLCEQIKSEEVSQTAPSITLAFLSTCSRQDLMHLFPSKPLDLLDMGDASESTITGSGR
jgi:hypothetical protein